MVSAQDRGPADDQYPRQVPADGQCPTQVPADGQCPRQAPEDGQCPRQVLVELSRHYFTQNLIHLLSVNYLGGGGFMNRC